MPLIFGGIMSLKELRERKASITKKSFSRVFIFLLIVVSCFLVWGTWLCRIYALGIGISMVWSGIASIFSGQNFLVHTGTSSPLPLFQFNPGLGNFCVGWGILCSVIVGWGKELSDKFLLIYVAILGIVNLVVGLMNLLGTLAEIFISVPGLWGSILSITIGLSIVYAGTLTWEAAK
jgi:hypothetical protein